MSLHGRGRREAEGDPALTPRCLQENPNAIPEGETPHNVTLLCYDPLVDVTKPGDRITVTGVADVSPLTPDPLHRQL